jgi:hypothetical protein
MEPVHPRDGASSLVTLYGMFRWILQEKPDGYWMATSRLTLKYVRLTSAMSISRHHPPTKTTSYAVLSLE